MIEPRLNDFFCADIDQVQAWAPTSPSHVHYDLEMTIGPDPWFNSPSQRRTVGRGSLRVPRPMLIVGGFAAVSCLALAAALIAGPSGGDLAKQQPKYKIDRIPPAPILSPQDEQKTFKLPPGFRIELVAAEPLVEEPVALTFDADGRAYVVEMRGYMPDMAGTGELDPVGRIVRLEDTDGDGRLDKKTIFVDKLIAPRAVGLAGDGVLVGEPPNVWFCRDKDGDGVSDEKTLVAGDFGQRNPNPEHMANGLTWVLDNWYYNADWGGRFRYAKGKFLRDGTIVRGQWGISADDTGGLYYNSNSSMLRADLMPAQYLTRNPYFPTPPGLNVAVAKNAVFTNRVNPGVNRGYTEDVNLAGHLQRVTAACGPTVYRGDNFPPEFRGNVFVCEPAGNVVVRHVITADGVTLSGKSVQTDGVDFLTSTDERFRPVNLYTAPDGSLYLIDLYHGILQHKAYLSAYLQDQVQKRDLDKNDGHRGRIWRIVHESAKPGPAPKLSKAPMADLVKALSHANGWVRDTAQRLIVERQDEAAAPLLEDVVGSAKVAPPLAKVHALWALQGLDKLDDDVVAGAVKDADPRVRLAAMRVGEVLVRKHIGTSILAAMQTLADDPDANVQLQLLAMASADVPELMPAANKILAARAGEPIFRAAALNGAAGRELETIQALLADQAFLAAATPKGQAELFNDLAECIARSRSPERVEKLFDVIAAQGGPAAEAMLVGVSEAVAPPAKGKPPTRRLRLLREPASLTKLAADASKKRLAEHAKKVEAGLSWPGKPGDDTPPLKPLTAQQQKWFDAGRVTFTTVCAQCHQPSGLGQDGVAPPLVDSEWVLGPPARLARIALNGVHGPIKIGKRTVDMEMPGLYTMSDPEISGVLTYVRREWGHEGSPVAPEIVAGARKESEPRGQVQWTAEELSKVK